MTHWVVTKHEITADRREQGKLLLQLCVLPPDPCILCQEREKTMKRLTYCVLFLVLCVAGSFSANAEEIEGVFCPVIHSDMPIAYGNVVKCSFEEGERHSYKFEGKKDEHLVIAATRWGSCEPCVELKDPDGVVLKTACANWGQNRIDATLERTGFYQIKVKEGSEHAGSYVLVLERISPSSPSATSIKSGDFVEGEITPPGDIDIFSFAGSKGDAFLISALKRGPLSPCLEFYRPNGMLLQKACTYSPQNPTKFSLPKDGNYTLLVRDFDGDYDGSGEGAYSLNLERIDPPPDPTQIRLGEVEHGEISPEGDVDFFLFEAKMGETFVFFYGEQSDSLGLCFEFYRPDGSRFKKLCDNSPASSPPHEFFFTAAQEGNHTIMVYDAAWSHEGEYSLALQRTKPRSPSTAVIKPGDVTAGEIGPGGDLQTYSFAGEKGDMFVIHGTSSSESFGRLCLELYGPDGIRLKNACADVFDSLPTFDFTSPQDGNYTIIVRDFEWATEGDYTIALERIKPSSPSAVPVAVGTSVQYLLKPYGDIDLFVFHAAKNNEREIKVTSNLFSPCIRLYRPDGKLAAKQCGSSPNDLKPKLTQTGTYSILVTGSEWKDRGSYTLNLW